MVCVFVYNHIAANSSARRAQIIALIYAANLPGRNKAHESTVLCVRTHARTAAGLAAHEQQQAAGSGQRAAIIMVMTTVMKRSQTAASSRPGRGRLAQNLPVLASAALLLLLLTTICSQQENNNNAMNNKQATRRVDSRFDFTSQS